MGNTVIDLCSSCQLGTYNSQEKYNQSQNFLDDKGNEKGGYMVHINRIIQMKTRQHIVN